MKKIVLSLVVLISFAGLLQAQTVCDSLDVKVQFNPFYDSLVEVRVVNHSSKFFTYPTFVLYNSNNDTVAKETMNLFGIGAASSHLLPIHPSYTGGSSFFGRLELYTYNYDTLSCTFPMSFDLCPDSCRQAIVYLGNMGGAMFTGTVNYAIKNSAAQTVKSGVLTIGSSQYDADTTCLYPGSYTVHFSQIALTGGGAKYYGVTQDSMTQMGPSWIYNQTNDTSFSFHFYKKCTLPNAVNCLAAAAQTLLVQQANGALLVRNNDGKPMERVALYALDGRLVHQEQTRSQQFVLPTATLIPGLYIIQVKTEGRISAVKVLID